MGVGKGLRERLQKLSAFFKSFRRPDLENSCEALTLVESEMIYLQLHVFDTSDEILKFHVIFGNLALSNRPKFRKESICNAHKSFRDEDVGSKLKSSLTNCLPDVGQMPQHSGI